MACQTHHCSLRWAEFSQCFCSLPCTFCEHFLLRIRTSIQVPSKDLQLSTSLHLHPPLTTSVSADNSLFWWDSPWQNSGAVLIRNLPKLAIILRSCAGAFSTGTPSTNCPTSPRTVPHFRTAHTATSTVAKPTPSIDIPSPLFGSRPAHAVPPNTLTNSTNEVLPNQASLTLLIAPTDEFTSGQALSIPAAINSLSKPLLGQSRSSSEWIH